MSRATAPAAVVPFWLRFLRGVGSFIAWSAGVSVIVIAGQAAGLPNSNGLQLIDALAAVGIYCLCVRTIERRTPTEFSLPGAGAEYLAGFGIGMGIFIVTIGVFAVAGWYRVHTITWSLQTLTSGLALCIAVAVFEEISVRAYFCRFVQSSLGSWAAIALSAALFGALHLWNPNATLWSSAAIAIEAGVLLAAAFILTGRLWIAIGIHTSWNFAEGTLFGTPVSGTAFESITRATLAGPSLLTGGTFGPEASIVTVTLCTLISVALLYAIVKAQRVVPPPWMPRTVAERAPA